MSEHEKPLAPGEIRTHTVGARRFQVMHVSGGAFTQATVRDGDGPTAVLAADLFDFRVLRVYADAIAAAEVEQDATPAGLVDAPQDRSADGVPEVEQDDDIAKLRRLVQPYMPNPDGRNGALALLDSLAANTPAEARTGRSDRVAAALNELSALQAKLHPTSAISTHLAHIESLLKGEAGMLPQRATDEGEPIWQHSCLNDTPEPSGPTYDANVLRGMLHAHIEAGHGLLESAMGALSRLEGRALAAGELPAGADEDALNSIERLRSKMMGLGNRDGTSALYHLAIVERALRARFDA